MNTRRSKRLFAATLATMFVVAGGPSASIGAVHVDPGGGNKDYGGIPVDNGAVSTPKKNPKSGTTQGTDGQGAGAIVIPCYDLGTCPSPDQMKDKRAQATKAAIATTSQVADDYSSWLIDRFGNRTVTN